MQSIRPAPDVRSGGGTVSSWGTGTGFSGNRYSCIVNVKRLQELKATMFKRSLQTKIFAAFSVVILFALSSVGLIVYLNLTNSIKSNAIDYVTDNIHRADDTVNTALKDANVLLATVVTNEENVIDVIRSEHYEVSYEWFREQKRLKNFLTYLAANRPHITRISVAGSNGKLYSIGAPWLDASNLNRPLVERILGSPDERYFVEERDGRRAVTVGRTIKYSNEVIGVVMIDLNYKVIAQSYNIEPSDDSMIYVVDRNGAFVYRTEGASAPRELLEDVAGTNYVGERKVGGKGHLVVSYTSDFTGWTTIGLIPEHTLIQDSLALRRQIAQVVVLVFAIVLIVSVAISSQIAKNLKKLRNAMLWVQDGNLTVTTRIDSNDEVGQLSELFIAMLEKLKRLMDDMKQRERQKREAELAALQAQIKPHFLYNTLNTIKYMASFQQAKNIEEVATSLIELLRGVLGNTKEFVTLEEELHYVNSFVNIQKHKFNDKFTVVYDVEPELLRRKVLKLILQPLVENAIYHGISPLKEPGFIRVRACRDGDLMMLEVSDTGVGMTEEQLRRTMEVDVMKDSVRYGGMGLVNVHERLKLVYGPHCGLQLYSRPDAYTKVVITIPIEGEERPA